MTIGEINGEISIDLSPALDAINRIQAKTEAEPEFEKQRRAIRAITEASAEQLDEMIENARKLGPGQGALPQYLEFKRRFMSPVPFPWTTDLRTQRVEFALGRGRSIAASMETLRALEQNSNYLQLRSMSSDEFERLVEHLERARFQDRAEKASEAMRTMSGAVRGVADAFSRMGLILGAHSSYVIGRMMGAPVRIISVEMSRREIYRCTRQNLRRQRRYARDRIRANGTKMRDDSAALVTLQRMKGRGK